MKYQVGDDVVYPAHGAGRIVNLTTRKVGTEVKHYYVIELLCSDTKLMAPVGMSDQIGLRRVIEKKKVDLVLNAVANGRLVLPKQWNSRFQKEQQILAGGDIFKVAELVGTLGRLDMEKESGLASTERRLYEEARQALASELAVAQRVDTKTALSQLDEALKE